MARLMDELIERASSSSTQGSRGLAATGQLAVQRLERLVQVAARINTTPGSPPLAAFLEAVQLFIDGFQGGGASRLVSIARPPIVAYGLYDFGGMDDPTRRLQARGCCAGCSEISKRLSTSGRIRRYDPYLDSTAIRTRVIMRTWMCKGFAMYRRQPRAWRSRSTSSVGSLDG